jgi:hypothetical protein
MSGFEKENTKLVNLLAYAPQERCCLPGFFWGAWFEGLFQNWALAQLGVEQGPVFFGPVFVFVFCFPSGNRSSNRWTQIGRTGALAIARLTILGRRGGLTRSQPAETKVMWGLHGSHGFFSFLARRISLGSQPLASTRGLLRIGFRSGHEQMQCEPQGVRIFTVK